MTREAFKAARLALGMTQAALADAMGYSGKSVICGKEKGRRPVTPRDALAMTALEMAQELALDGRKMVQWANSASATRRLAGATPEQVSPRPPSRPPTP